MSNDARITPLSAGEALRRAFGSLPIGEPGTSHHKFELSQDQARHALVALGQYFFAVDPLYSGIPNASSDAESGEIWSFFDPVSVAGETRNQTAIGWAVHQEAVDRVVRVVKGFGLYAHRIVLEDHLYGWLQEYADPPELSRKSDIWLLSAISFSLSLYMALIDYLDNDIVVLMRGVTTGREHQRQDEAERTMFPRPDERTTLIRDLLGYIEAAHPRDPLISEHRDWPGGPVYGGTVGGLLLDRQKDLRILANGMMDYTINSSLFYPRLTVAWTDPKLARLHRYYLYYLHVEATQRELGRSCMLTELSTNGAVQPDAVSAADVLSMRWNERIFADWRSMVEDCISELRDSYATGSDREDLLKRAVREREREWQTKFKALTETSSVFGRIVNPRTSFLTSLSVGAAYGLIVKHDPVSASLIAGGGSAAKDTLISLADLVFGGGRRAAKISLRNHFTALGARSNLFGS